MNSNTLAVVVNSLSHTLAKNYGAVLVTIFFKKSMALFICMPFHMEIKCSINFYKFVEDLTKLLEETTDIN